MYQINDNEPIKYINQSYFIDLFSDFSAIISFLIYLEIIELNFCDFNKNLRKNKKMRGNMDAKINDNDQRESYISNLIEENDMDELNLIKN